ncbi:MAG: phage major capsid protein, partial [Candidatus Nanopelagicales bacterium]
KRELDAEEQSRYATIMKDASGIKEKLDREMELIEQEKAVAQASLSRSDESKSKKAPEAPEAELRTKAFRNLIVNGAGALTPDESRALSAGTDTAAGFLVAPMEFVKQLIVKVKDQVFMRGEATIFPLNTGVSMGAPSLETDVDDADWTPEITAVKEDAGLSFGRRELTPHALSKLVKISNKLLRSAALDPESIVMDRLAYKFGISMEKGYLVGNGNQQPLGVFVASSLGINTDRDVYGVGMDSPNTQTALGADSLIAAKYNLKAQYMAKAKWLFHRDAVKQLAALKTGDGEYLLELSTIVGAPDVLLGRPLMMSEYVPNTFTAGKYVGMFADFSQYWIADSLSLQFQRLNELYALNNQIGFIGRLETDGMPVLPEAFSRICLAP